jgi:hypothetical protein
MMIRYKSNKQTLIIAALVILLCLSCLSGATFAIFTNDLDEGTIGVVATSGNMKIDIVDLLGNTLQNNALKFDVTSTATEDEDILFEPGAIFYTEGFKVENKGDVPVNFRISVSKDESIDMEAFDEAFELWIVRKGDDFSSAQNLPEFEVKGLPAYTSSDTYFLFIKMKETAGNQFQKQSYSGIGITVYAVQGNVEIE